MRGARRVGPTPNVRGMTLVELMVGVALGMFLVAVMGTIYLGSKSTFLAQDGGARLQENGRFAMDMLSQDLRMSGFRGCQTGSSVTNTLNTPGALALDFGQPIWGARHTGGAWSPALAAPVSALAPDAAGDVVLVRRPVGNGWALVAEMASDSAALNITPTADFARGDLLLLADCAGAAVLQATNATPGTAGVVEHDRTVTDLSPGVAQNSLGRVYAHDARLWRLQTLVYHLAESARHPGERALWLLRSPAYGEAERSELVTGVEAMAVTYGLDTNADFAADRFARADQVANWQQVVAARVELLLVGPREGGATSAQPYTFDGSTTTPADLRPRTVVSMLVSLRNSVP